MKILFLCPDLGIPVLGRKGASVHVRELVAALQGQGHQVIVAAQLLNKSPWEKPAELNATVIQVRSGSVAGNAVQALKDFNAQLGIENSLPGELRRLLYNQELGADLMRRFENAPPDFIYERASLYATAGIGLARALKVPHLLELNAPLAVEQSAYRATGFGELAAQAERWLLNHTDAVIPVSATLGRHVARLGVPRSRIHAMPNAVAPSLFHPAPRDPNTRSRLGLGEGPVLGFVGGLRPWHGVESLPPLLARLTRRHPGLQLVFAGDGPLRQPLEKALRESGLRDRAIFTGLLAHEEIPAVIREFDLALAPYPKAGHDFYFSPLKLFEYLACGVPVVAARLGQISEILRHDRTGLLYAPGKITELAACCDRLLSDAALRQRLGRAGARLVAARFTWDHNARRVIKLASRLRHISQP